MSDWRQSLTRQEASEATRGCGCGARHRSCCCCHGGQGRRFAQTNVRRQSLRRCRPRVAAASVGREQLLRGGELAVELACCLANGRGHCASVWAAARCKCWERGSPGEVGGAEEPRGGVAGVVCVGGRARQEPVLARRRADRECGRRAAQRAEEAEFAHLERARDSRAGRGVTLRPHRRSAAWISCLGAPCRPTAPNTRSSSARGVLSLRASSKRRRPRSASGACCTTFMRTSVRPLCAHWTSIRTMCPCSRARRSSRYGSTRIAA
jgi:hypothetical protein